MAGDQRRMAQRFALEAPHQEALAQPLYQGVRS